MKATKIIFILFVMFASRTLVGAQEQVYKAEMLVKSGNELTTQSVALAIEKENLAIRRTKKPYRVTYLPLAEIESADYAYSNRPRYTAATLGAIAFGIAALPVFFMKTKKNWLTVNAGANSAIFQLRGENYRMFLLLLKKNNVNINDSGDLDKNAN